MGSLAQPRRTSYPDLSPAARIAAPTPRPEGPPRRSRTITIPGADGRLRPYEVEALDLRGTDPEVALLYALTTDQGEVYHVAELASGEQSCTCADYEFAHRGQGTRCKHLRALTTLALISDRVLIDFAAGQEVSYPEARARRRMSSGNAYYRAEPKPPGDEDCLPGRIG